MHQAVLPLDGFAKDRQSAGLDITQPDLGNAVARIERKLDIAVVIEGGVGNLDDQQDVSGCRSAWLARLTRVMSG